MRSPETIGMRYEVYLVQAGELRLASKHLTLPTARDAYEGLVTTGESVELHCVSRKLVARHSPASKRGER